MTTPTPEEERYTARFDLQAPAIEANLGALVREGYDRRLLLEVGVAAAAFGGDAGLRVLSDLDSFRRLADEALTQFRRAQARLN